MAIVLGIDPGSRKTGFGIVSTAAGRPCYVTSGVIRLPTESGLPIRLKVLSDSLTELIETFRPDTAAVEEVFMAKSAGSALKLGQARGAAVVVCASAGLEVHEYAARQIKQAVVGTGAADKEQVQHMVTRLLRLPATPQEDASDALAAALCHINGEQARALTGDQYGGGRRRR